MAELIAAHDAVARLKQARQDARGQWLADGRIVRYYNGAQGVPYTPPSATPEYRQLQRRSITNVVRLAAGVMAAGLYVDGIVPADLDLNATAEEAAAADAAATLEAAIEYAAGWRYWQAAQLDSGQSLATLRAVVLGYANVVSWVTEPGGLGNEHGTEQLVEVRSLNPLNSWAGFLDVEDDHPDVLVRRLGGKGGLAQGSALWEVWASDEEGGYRVELDERDGTIRKEWRHDLEHVPATRLVGNRDLEGNPEGTVMPLRAAQDRLNESVFSLLMAQTFQSFRQRWAVGVKDLQLNPGVDRVWHTESGKDGAAFGEFSAADLANIVKAVESALGTFAALAKIPPQNVLGLPSNIGPEALAAAEAGHTRDRGNWQRNLSRGWLEVTRDVGALAGDDEVADDYGAQVHWATTESRSFAQVVDGLVKLTSGDRPILPVDVAIELVPGLTQTDRRRALRVLRQQPATGLGAVTSQTGAALLPDMASLLGVGSSTAGTGGPLA